MKILLEIIYIILKLLIKNLNLKLEIKYDVSLLKNTFEKSYTSNYSEEIFIIDDIKTTNVHYYFLKDLSGEKIDGIFLRTRIIKN